MSNVIAAISPLRKSKSCHFDFEAKRRREITAHARHVEAANTEDFERWLIAFQWNNPKAADPIWSLRQAAIRMGGDISEADAAELAQQPYPKRLTADALGAWLGVTYRQRQDLRLTTIGCVDVKKRARLELRKRKARLREERRRRAQGAKPRSQALSRIKPWEALGISRRTWERRRNIARDANSCAPISLSLAHESAATSLPSKKARKQESKNLSHNFECSSRKAILIRADQTATDATSSAVLRPFQAVPRPPGYDPVAAALERKTAYGNRRGR